MPPAHHPLTTGKGRLHEVERTCLSGAAFLDTFRLWPYFLLLGGGITLTELYLLRRGRAARACRYASDARRAYFSPPTWRRSVMS